MPIYLYRLTPPRPTFPADITAEEGDAMQRHFAYWAEHVKRGNAVAVGPVMDPEGAYGIAVLNAANEAEAGNLCASDPVILANLGFTVGLYEMPNALVGSITRGT